MSAPTPPSPPTAAARSSNGADPGAAAPYSYRRAGVPDFPDDKPLIVFDGMCVLCSRFAQLVLRRDTARRFRMTAIQSPLGEALARHYGIDPLNPSTSLLIQDGRLYEKARAAIEILRHLGFPWWLALAGRALPRPVADWLYDRIARNRIAWFGARDACLVPDPADAGRFIA